MKFLLFALTLVGHFSASAQRKIDFYALNQVIQAAPYAGKKIRLEAAVRMEALDSAAKTGLWLRVDKKDHKPGFFRNTWDEPVVGTDWKTIVIEGEVAKDALVIVFGGLFTGKGQFYFDHFRMSYYDKQQWLSIPLSNASFEDPAGGGWLLGHQQESLPLTLSDRQPVDGQRVFWFDGSHNKSNYQYGSNPEAGHYAPVNGIQLYYEVYGKGEPLLLLHGNGQSIGELAQQIDFFKDKYQVIAVDTRGHGKSGTDTTRYTYHLFAQDIHALLQHLQLDSVRILGWSDGGNTGLILAMQYPRQVKKLGVMGSNIFINKDAVKPVVFKEINRLLKEHATENTAKGRQAIRLMHLLLEEPNMRFEDLRAIQCPVLVMAGENDLIKEAHTRGIAQHIPRAELVIFPKSGHYLPQENAPLYNKTVWTFFQQP